MREAYRREIIKGNPADLVSQVSGPAKERVALTLPQARAVFESHENWADLRHYGINLTAFTTGARMGELQGLEWQHVHDDYISIVQAWDRRLKQVKDPKWNSRRVIPIRHYTKAVLDELRSMSPYSSPEDFVFYTANRESPMDPHEINQKLKSALKAAKVKGVDFTFHGWRHTYVSLLRTEVDETTVRLLPPLDNRPTPPVENWRRPATGGHLMTRLLTSTAAREPTTLH